MKERLATLSSHVAELEEDLDTARKDLIKSEEMNSKLQRDVREVSGARKTVLPTGGAFGARDTWLLSASPSPFQPGGSCTAAVMEKSTCAWLPRCEASFPQLGGCRLRLSSGHCLAPA